MHHKSVLGRVVEAPVFGRWPIMTPFAPRVHCSRAFTVFFVKSTDRTEGRGQYNCDLLSTIRYSQGMEAAGSLVRAARQQAGLSQAELGRRAGVTQSVISAYESGTRQPSMPTLTRLIEATGAELDVRVQYSANAQAPGGALARRVRDHRDEILAVLRRCGLTNPRLFGSVARGDETSGSDVDLLVDVPTGVGLFALARCQADLESVLGAPVDLVPAADLKPGVADQALADAVAL